MNNKQAFALAASKSQKHVSLMHLHGKSCTFEVCGVGPTRQQLIEASLRRLRS